MPWQECNRVTERVEFLELLTGGTVTMSELCRRFGISRKTGYKWRKRHEAGGRAELLDRSRRPLSSPSRTPQEIECLVVELRRPAGETEHQQFYCSKCDQLVYNKEFDCADIVKHFTQSMEDFWADPTLNTCKNCGHKNGKPTPIKQIIFEPEVKIIREGE